VNHEELRGAETPTDSVAAETTGAPTDGSGDDPTGNPTGNHAVDEVLGSLEGLADRPVDEHVAVFERAHDRLRAALSDAGRDDAAS
jgi:hypothetical protein